MKPLKSIYKRRSRYGWLMAEIIVASAIAFFVLDPIVVSIYDASRPYNYDIDRLVMVYLSPLDTHDPDYDSRRINSDDIESDILRTIYPLQTIPGVEKAIPLPERGFGGGADSDDNLFLPDSTSVAAFKATYIPGTDFFTTFGIKAAEGIPGNPTAEMMNDMTVDFYSQMICTRLEARLLYGDEYTAMEKSREQREYGMTLTDETRGYRTHDVPNLEIVGIVEDTRAWGDRPWPLVRFYSDPLSHSLTWNNTGLYNVCLRLEKGESAKAMARRLNRDPELQQLCRSGILEFDHALPYSEVNGASTVLSPKERYRNVLVIFFAINIFLGVFGTFWLLTRKRTEEAGIMRAFGATPANVRRMLYAEGTIIALSSSLIGCAVYVFYLFHNPGALEMGLSEYAPAYRYSEGVTGTLPAELSTWVGDFWIHCGVITGVVSLLMLIVVLLGIAIPAWHLSRVHPVEALSEES